jgi:hypothetical protein
MAGAEQPQRPGPAAELQHGVMNQTWPFRQPVEALQPAAVPQQPLHLTAAAVPAPIHQHPIHQPLLPELLLQRHRQKTRPQPITALPPQHRRCGLIQHPATQPHQTLLRNSAAGAQRRTPRHRVAYCQGNRHRAACSGCHSLTPLVSNRQQSLCCCHGPCLRWPPWGWPPWGWLVLGCGSRRNRPLR